jgi:glutamate-1-semialdehyde 2,1-aminomutase
MSFRLAYGGGQEMFGMQPDITTLGKIIGGGFPVGAVAGSSEIMQVFDPTGGEAKVPHGGTFNANPITMVAGRVTLEKFTAAEVKRLNSLGDSLRTKLTELFSRSGVKAQVAGAGSMFRIHLTSDPLTDYRSSFLYPDKKEMMTRLFFKLLEAGIFMPSEGMGCLSTPMTMKEVDRFVAAVETSLATLIEEYPELKR